MKKISEFVQVRADGQLVPANMAVNEMLSLGWMPSKVIGLRWKHDDAVVEFASQQGVHGVVVPGENFVAAILEGSESGTASRLVVLSADGSMHGSLESQLPVSEAGLEGHYSWFEPAMEPETDKFGVVFQEKGGGSFRCDIDARKPGLSKIIPIR